MGKEVFKKNSFLFFLSVQLKCILHDYGDESVKFYLKHNIQFLCKLENIYIFLCFTVESRRRIWLYALFVEI